MSLLLNVWGYNVFDYKINIFDIKEILSPLILTIT